MTRILYPLLPSMDSCNRCGECCGPVAVTEREAESILRYMAEKNMRWREVDLLTCGLYDPKGRCCDIYPVRPFACRLYGVARELACPHFPSAAVMSYPADRAVAEGWMDGDSELLSSVVYAAEEARKMYFDYVEVT